MFDSLIKSVLANAISISARVVVLGLGLVVAKELDCGEALDAIRLTNALVLSHVDSADFDDALELLGCELPRWGQLLTVTTPWCVELDEPHAVFVIEDFFLKVSSG